MPPFVDYLYDFHHFVSKRLYTLISRLFNQSNLLYLVLHTRRRRIDDIHTAG